MRPTWPEASAHPLGHAEARHEHELTVDAHRAVWRVTIDVPRALVDTEGERVELGRELVAGLDLRVDGATVGVASLRDQRESGLGWAFVLEQEVPLPRSPVRLTATDANLPDEHNLFRWRITGPRAEPRTESALWSSFEVDRTRDLELPTATDGAPELWIPAVAMLTATALWVRWWRRPRAR